MASSRASISGVALVLCAALNGACSSDPAPVPSAPVDASTEKSPPPSPDGDVPLVPGPDKLSETGLYADFANRTLADGVRPFAPKFPSWFDGDTTRRWLLLPPATKISTVGMDDWVFPVGTKAWQEVTVKGVVMETRFLWKARPDAWFQVAYAWLANGSDALAAPNGAPNAGGTTHDIPSRKACIDCHGEVLDQLLGVSALELSDGGNGFLATLIAEGRLSHPPAGEFTMPGDDVERAALGSLHANCGGCHNDFSNVNMQTPMRLRVLTSETTAASAAPFRTSVGVKMVHMIPPDITDVLVPGDPNHSGLLERMLRRDSWGMPIHSKKIDAQGCDAVRSWITAMPAVSDGGTD